MSAGPLTGLRVVEFAGIGPGPHAAMLLADLGADVVRLDRPTSAVEPDGVTSTDAVMRRGRHTVTVDLKDRDQLDVVTQLVDRADVVIEGYRPGVLERLGLDPLDMLARNDRLVIARLTGWGQDGPEAQVAGHDLNYLAATGMLQALGRAGEPPAPPLNLVADFGGGSMFALLGIMSALFERESSGRGQVVDVSMVEGTLSLSAMIWSWRAAGRWNEQRGTNILDGGAPFYDTYACEDGRFMAIGSLEPRFYALALAGLGIDATGLPSQYDPDGWPQVRAAIAGAFADRTQAHWISVFDGTDACVSPVLTFDEAQQHEHLQQRNAFVSVDGVSQPAASPRFSRSVPHPPGAETFGHLSEAVDRWAGAAPVSERTRSA